MDKDNDRKPSGFQQKLRLSEVGFLLSTHSLLGTVEGSWFKASSGDKGVRGPRTLEKLVEPPTPF
jgi:hypothetical protein